MGKLTEFYKQHRRLFLAQKHQNTSKTQKFRDKVAIKFFSFCESQNLLHTDGIRKKQVLKDLFGTNEFNEAVFGTAIVIYTFPFGLTP